MNDRPKKNNAKKITSQHYINKANRKMIKLWKK